jgi:hypothetical protein
MSGLVALIVACSARNHQPSPLPAAAGSRSGPNAGGGAKPGISAPTREHGVVERRCARPAYGDAWLLVPTSTDCGPRCTAGTACSSSDDCRERSFGQCIGLPAKACSYAGAKSDPPEHCQQDSDCKAAPAGQCPKEISLTFCLYDECQVDSDCRADQQCQCPSDDADPLCVTLGCDVDADCAAGQVCLTDKSYSGFPAVRHCSTERDSCASHSDCKLAPDDNCGFDSDERRWLCRPHTFVD